MQRMNTFKTSFHVLSCLLIKIVDSLELILISNRLTQDIYFCSLYSDHFSLSYSQRLSFFKKLIN